MDQLDATTSVGQWVTQHPQTARVLETHQIDYCCGGGVSLAEACEKKQIDSQELVERLNRSIDDDDDNESDSRENWTEASLTDLCDHIQATHHVYMREELPRLTLLIDKVVSAHGANHPELTDLQKAFRSLQEELTPHMFKEEQILFPAIRQMEQSTAAPMFPFGTISNPIGAMEHEHASAGVALARIRKLTDQYRVPEDACNTYHVMLDSLAHLEEDLHLHIHKENNILFPRAQRLEHSSTAV